MKNILATRIDKETGAILRFLQKRTEYRGRGGKSAAVRDAFKKAFGAEFAESQTRYTDRKLRECSR